LQPWSNAAAAYVSNAQIDRRFPKHHGLPPQRAVLSFRLEAWAQLADEVME